MNISPIVIERFGISMRERLMTGEVPFRKAYLGAIVDRVEVDDREIRLSAEKTYWAGDDGERPGAGCSHFVEWRAGQDETASTYVIAITV